MLVLVRINYNANHYGETHHGLDENLTLGQAMDSFYGKGGQNYKAQEGVRWLIKLSIPYAMFKSSFVLGGNISETQRSIYGYLSDKDPNDSKDPNIREFLYHLRVISIVLVFASFLPLQVWLWREGLGYSAGMIVLLVGLSPHVIYEQKFTYIEPTVIACINLLIYSFLVFYRRTSISIAETFLVGFLSAFAMSVKLTSALFCLLPAIGIVFALHKSPKSWIRLVALWAGTTGLMYVVINYPLLLGQQERNKFLDELFWNFWHYTQGGLFAPGWPHFMHALTQFFHLTGLLTFIAPLIILTGLLARGSRYRVAIGVVAALTIVSIYSVVQLSLFWQRNFIIYYVPFLLCTFLSIEAIAERWDGYTFSLFRQRISLRRKWIFLCTFIVAMPLYLYIPVSPVLHDLEPILSYSPFPSCKTNLIRNLGRVAVQLSNPEIHAIGFESEWFKDSEFAKIIKYEESFPVTYKNEKFSSIKADFLRRLGPSRPNAIVLVNRSGKNFQLTNYILWKEFYANHQWCSYFIFENRIPMNELHSVMSQ